MRIAEIYESIQGEGLLTGTPSVFVRVSGCNLRCRFCDTPFASWRPEGEQHLVDEIVARVKELPASHVILTGGEPMIFAESVELTMALRHLGRHITIETAGTRYMPVACDLMSISPKLSNSTPGLKGSGVFISSSDRTEGRAPAQSTTPDPFNDLWTARHERRRHAPNVIRQLVAEYAYQLKFVVATVDDCREVEEYLLGFPEVDESRVLLMPMGTDAALLAETAIWLEPYCAEHGWHYCPRRHVEWFGGVVRGT
jgi:7-carboxy-7-deazaguanine synthase